MRARGAIGTATSEISQQALLILLQLGPRADDVLLIMCQEHRQTVLRRFQLGERVGERTCFDDVAAKVFFAETRGISADNIAAGRKFEA
jgi:hypothetical protein